MHTFRQIFIVILGVWSLAFSQYVSTSATDSTKQHAILPRFSMAFLLTPYQSPAFTLPRIQENYYYPYIEIPAPDWQFYYKFDSQQESYLAASGNFEGRIWHRIYFQANIGIFQQKFSIRQEVIISNPVIISDPNHTTQQFQELQSTVTLIVPEIGVKYFLTTPHSGKASPYIMAGGGFQIPFVHFQYDPTTPDTTKRYNFKDFLRDANSATHFYSGLGGEYRINPSLALLTEIRWVFLFQKATYIKQANYGNYSSTNTNYWKLQTIRTLWSLGIRMYF